MRLISSETGRDRTQKERCGDRKQAVTTFRMTKPTGLTPGYEKKHRHAGVIRGKRNHNTLGMYEAETLCSGAGTAILPSLA